MLTFILDYTNQYIFNITSHLLEYQFDAQLERRKRKMEMTNVCLFGFGKVNGGFGVGQ